MKNLILFLTLIFCANSFAAGSNTILQTMEMWFKQITTPSNPVSGKNKAYFKSDDKLYFLNSAGVETTPLLNTLNLSTTAPISGGGSLASGLTLSMPAATGSQNGYLTSTDWTTFNSKQSAGNYITSLTSDVTASGPGAATATIASNVVTNAKLAQMAANTFKANNTGGVANASDITATQATAMLDNFVGDSGSGGTKGLVPAPGVGDATKYLKGDGTWGTVSAGGITTLNTLTASTQTFATGTSGTDFNISSTTSTHTFNIPDASATNRGVVTTGAQELAGQKTLSTAPILSSLTASRPLKLDASKVATASQIDLSSSNDVTGTCVVANGCTGASTLTANNVILGNGTSPVQFVAPGTSGNILTSNGTTWISAAPPSVANAVLILGYSEIVGSSAADGQIPADNTIPQVSEGTEIFSLSVTPTRIGAKLHVEVDVKAMEETNTGSVIAIALFKNGAADAVAVDANGIQDATTSLNEGRMIIEYRETVASLTPITFSVRIGGNSVAQDIVLNESEIHNTPADVDYGNKIASWIKVTEANY